MGSLGVIIYLWGKVQWDQIHQLGETLFNFCPLCCGSNWFSLLFPIMMWTLNKFVKDWPVLFLNFMLLFNLGVIWLCIAPVVPTESSVWFLFFCLMPETMDLSCISSSQIPLFHYQWYLGEFQSYPFWLTILKALECSKLKSKDHVHIVVVLVKFYGPTVTSRMLFIFWINPPVTYKG